MKLSKKRIGGPARPEPTLHSFTPGTKWVASLGNPADPQEMVDFLEGMEIQGIEPKFIIPGPVEGSLLVIGRRKDQLLHLN